MPQFVGDAKKALKEKYGKGSPLSKKTLMRKTRKKKRKKGRKF